MKNCKNCGNYSTKSRLCIVSGYSWQQTRQSGKVCDAEFSAWVPRPTLADKLQKLFGGGE